MPKKKVEKDGKVEFKGYARFELNAAHKAAIGRLFQEELSIWVLMERLAEHGYKVSFTYRDAQDAFQVTAYGNVPDNPNAGYALSFWHSDITKAISALYFVIAEVYQWSGWDNLNGYDNTYDW